MTKLIKKDRNSNRLMDPFFEGFFNPSMFGHWETGFTPRVDIEETEDNISMEFEIPGMRKDDIKVTVENNILSVAGKREHKEEEKEKSYIRREIASGSFIREFTLPESVDTGSIKADYKDGILKLEIKKKEEAKPKQIEVEVS